MNTYTVGQTVTIEVKDYGTMQGTIGRIVKMAAPCVPTDDVSKWTFHVEVVSNHPRKSGTFCVGIGQMKIAE